MLRLLVLASAVLALAGSASSVNQFSQEGTVAAPRAPLDDGQPMEERMRLELRGGVAGEAEPAGGRPRVTAGDEESAAAMARKHAGAALRVRGGAVDLQFEVEGAWSPAPTTPDGAAIDAPDEVVVGATVGLRASTPLGDGARLGFAVDAGGVSVPIRRDSPAETARAGAFVGRLALVPSVRLGSVTLFGVAGLSTITEVPPAVIWNSDDGDPGVVAGAGGPALVYAAGATVDLGRRARLTARIGDAVEVDRDDARYAPQVDVGVAIPFDR